MAEDEGVEDSLPPAPDLQYEGYHVMVMDAYAITEIERVMTNFLEEPLDYTFYFRIPFGALISNFSMEVLGITYYADVLEKEKANEKYQQAVEAGYTAGLVRSMGNQVFAYQVSFASGETMVAKLRYEQVLLKTNGWQSYELLLNETSRSTIADKFEIDIEVTTSSSIEELQTSGYSEEISVLWFSQTQAAAMVEAIELEPEENLEIRWRCKPSGPGGIFYFAEYDESGYFLHVYDPDPAIIGPPINKDFVFVMDTSGSMSGRKFEQSKAALSLIYERLRTGDTFSFLSFNTGVGVFSENLLPATEDNIQNVLHFIHMLEAGGGTDIHSGVVEALDIFKVAGDTMPVIVLLSDGRANHGIYHQSDFRQDVLNRNTEDASIFCIALGDGAEWEFLEALAKENNGIAIWVHEAEDVETRIADFVDSFSSPIMMDLSMEYCQGIHDVHPSSLRAHFQGGEVLVSGRFPLDMEEVTFNLHATTANGEYSADASFPVEMVPMGDFVPRFWAFQRIKDLEDQMRVDGPDNGTVGEIVDLAIEFHFATDHTSLYVELPDELNERFHGSGEPYIPYIGAESLFQDGSYGAPSSAKGIDSTTNAYFVRGNNSPDLVGDTNLDPPKTYESHVPPNDLPPIDSKPSGGDTSSEGTIRFNLQFHTWIGISALSIIIMVITVVAVRRSR